MPRKVNNVHVRADEISVACSSAPPRDANGQARLRPRRRVRPIRIEEFPSIDAHRRRIRSYLQVVSNVGFVLADRFSRSPGLSPSLLLPPTVPPPLRSSLLRRNGRYHDSSCTTRKRNTQKEPRGCGPWTFAATGCRQTPTRRRRPDQELLTAASVSVGSPTI